MYLYYYNLLLSPFENAFQILASIHSYHNRVASKSIYYINSIKTNYGKFNIRFAAAKVWNQSDQSIKHLPLKTFKNKVKLNILQSHCSLVFSYSIVYFIFLLFSSCLIFFFWLIVLLKLLCQPTNQHLLRKYYLVLLNSISFLVILSNWYLNLN